MTKGICPKCSGTCRIPAGDSPYKHMFAGYDKATDTLRCNNCGGQYMESTPAGVVNLRPDGTSCMHEYTSKNVGRCLTQYTCKHCDDTYRIDSGD